MHFSLLPLSAPVESEDSEDEDLYGSLREEEKLGKLQSHNSRSKATSSTSSFCTSSYSNRPAANPLSQLPEAGSLGSSCNRTIQFDPSRELDLTLDSLTSQSASRRAGTSSTTDTGTVGNDDFSQEEKDRIARIMREQSVVDLQNDLTSDQAGGSSQDATSSSSSSSSSSFTSTLEPEPLTQPQRVRTVRKAKPEKMSRGARARMRRKQRGSHGWNVAVEEDLEEGLEGAAAQENVHVSSQQASQPERPHRSIDLYVPGWHWTPGVVLALLLMPLGGFFLYLFVDTCLGECEAWTPSTACAQNSTRCLWAWMFCIESG